MNSMSKDVGTSRLHTVYNSFITPVKNVGPNYGKYIKTWTFQPKLVKFSICLCLLATVKQPIKQSVRDKLRVSTLVRPINCTMRLKDNSKK